MKVLHVAAECATLASTGGLGEVIAALPAVGGTLQNLDLSANGLANEAAKLLAEAPRRKGGAAAEAAPRCCRSARSWPR